MIENKKILIMGGTGFIGKELFSKLNLLNNSISIISRKENNLKVKTIVADLTDEKNNIENKLIDFDIIFNCSGELKDEKKMRDLHVKTQNKIINFLSKKCLKLKKKIRWVQLSSVGVFGFNSKSKPKFLTEMSETNPSNTYESTKINF